MTAPALIHVGLSKTGTTALQQDVFPKFTGCELVTRWGTEGCATYRILSQNLRNAGDADYLEVTFRSYLRDRSRDGTRPLLWSDETLTGTQWKGVGRPLVVAERLHRLLPEATILLCVRNQRTRIRSLHSFYVVKGGTRSFRRFLDEAAPGIEFDLERLEYDRIVGAYQELFGVDRVKVVAYEHWRADPKQFLGEIASHVPSAEPVDLDFTVKEMNTALSGPSQRAMQYSNRLFRRTQYNPRPLVGDFVPAHNLRKQLNRVDRRLWPGARATLVPEDEARLERIVARYGASNERLAKMTGLPLGELGYPVTSLPSEPPRSTP